LGVGQPFQHQEGGAFGGEGAIAMEVEWAAGKAGIVSASDDARGLELFEEGGDEGGFGATGDDGIHGTLMEQRGAEGDGMGGGGAGGGDGEGGTANLKGDRERATQGGDGGLG
jgi:hypothetical protein